MGTEMIQRIVIPSDVITTLPITAMDVLGEHFPIWMSEISMAPTRRLRAELSPDGYALVLTPNGTHKRGVVVTVWSGDTPVQLRVVIADRVPFLIPN